MPIESALVDNCANEEWTIEDSVVIVPLISYLGLAETQSLAEKFLFQSMVSGIPLDPLKELFPHLRGVSSELLEIFKTVHLSKSIIPSSIPFLSNFPTFTASNNWVLLFFFFFFPYYLYLFINFCFFYFYFYLII